MGKRSIDALGQSASPAEGAFHCGQISRIPDIGRHYLEHAIAPEARIASAVRLRMHGEIKLRRWFPFKADQVICQNYGMIWNATLRMRGLPGPGSFLLGIFAAGITVLTIIEFLRARRASVPSETLQEVEA